MASTTVTVYRNGDRNYPGKKLVVNRRQIRSFDAFLDIVTHEVKMKWGARAICTPTDGHKIKELDKIQTGGAYVAVGPEHFKKLGYKDIREPKALPRKTEEITPVRHSKLVMSGRARKVADAEATAHKIFFVFRNGDDLYPSRKMLLKKSDLSSMDRVLAFVTEKVHLQSGAVYCLCNLQGQEIKDTSELQNNAQYVAVGHGKKFKKVAYSDHGATSITPRRTVPKPKFQPYRKNVTKVKLTHSKRSSETSSKDYMQETPEDRRVVTKLEPFEDAKVMQEEQIIDELVGSVSHPTQDGEEDTLEKTDEPEENVSRQIQEEENGERISSMLQTSEENSGLTEDTILRETGHLQNDQDESSSNLYNASGEQKEQGTEIKEDRDTVEDKPIDQLPAEEVVEEQIDKEPQLNERSDSLHE